MPTGKTIDPMAGIPLQSKGNLFEITNMGATPVSTGAKAYSPPITRKGKLVFFQHGLGADWTEFAMTVAGTSLRHDPSDISLLEEPNTIKYGDDKGKRKIKGLVQLDNKKIWDAGVISSKKIKNFSAQNDDYCSHSCTGLIADKLYDKLLEGNIVCVLTEFSTGVNSFKQQLEEMNTMVKTVESYLTGEFPKGYEYDVAFVGHSMGGLASINFGIDYAKRKENAMRKVDIITLCTPYYENALAKIEQNLFADGLNGRGKEGAQMDLGGFTASLFQLQCKWNEYSASQAARKHISLAAIAVQAQGTENQIADIGKEIKRYETDADYRSTVSPDYIQAQKDLMAVLKESNGSDYIVPVGVQHGIMPQKLIDEIQSMKEKLSKEEKIKKLEKKYSNEISKSTEQLNDFLKREEELASLIEKGQYERFDEYQTVRAAIEPLNDLITKTQGKKDKLQLYLSPWLKEYQNVNRIGPISKPNYALQSHILKIKAFEDYYHHVNTPDLTEVIQHIKDALMQGIQ